MFKFVLFFSFIIDEFLDEKFSINFWLALIRNYITGGDLFLKCHTHDVFCSASYLCGNDHYQSLMLQQEMLTLGAFTFEVTLRDVFGQIKRLAT